jgi:hypothetical protein
MSTRLLRQPWSIRRDSPREALKLPGLNRALTAMMISSKYTSPRASGRMMLPEALTTSTGLSLEMAQKMSLRLV